MGKERKKIGTIPIDEMEQEVHDFIEEVRQNEPVLTDSFESVENPEYSETSIDEERKVISYRKKDGTKVENVGFETPHISTEVINTEKLEGLSSEGLTDLEKALKANGFVGGTGDWTDYLSQDGTYPLNIPAPRCAIVNILSDYNLSQLSKEGYEANPPYWPAGVEGETYDIPTQIEFWDMQGNYFKKWIKMSGQGNSTMNSFKKNIAIDLFDDDTLEGVFAIKFGDWVAQDSFHLKAYHGEPTKAKCITGYRFYEKIIQTRGALHDYSWKNSSLIDFSSITPTTAGISDVSDFLLQLEGAKCFPDGFPVMVYQKGAFWGVYAFQLKKHRDNYKMKKAKTGHIHLDFDNVTSVFDAAGDASQIDWTQFEIRNPKPKKKSDGWDFINMAGKKYDGENPTEPIDPTSSKWDDEDQSCIKSYQVKQSVIALSQALVLLEQADAAYKADPTPENFENVRTVFNTYFDSDNMMDYTIFADITNNWDGVYHNSQWTTWDGVRWYINPYDLDTIFSYDRVNPHYHPDQHVSQGKYMFGYFETYFEEELKARYAKLRDSGVVSTDIICNIAKDWVLAIGASNYKAESERWPSEGFNDSILRIHEWLESEIELMDALYDYNQN